MKDAVFYTTGCPKCKILKAKLDAKGIPYETNYNVDEMFALGIRSAPALKIGEELLDFATAVKRINEME